MGLEFDSESGLLVPGEHLITITEFEATFVYNDRRKVIYNGFKELIRIFQQVQCTRLYVDGSFVTTKPFPGDIDVCWLMADEEAQRKEQLLKLKEICPPLQNLSQYNRNIIRKKFYADVFPANIIEMGSNLTFKDFFKIDKHTNGPKGIVVINIL